MDEADRQELRRAAAGELRRHWPSATTAGAADVAAHTARVWTAARELGWTALGDDAALDALLVVAEELGALACPVPVGDAYAAALLFAAAGIDVADRAVALAVPGATASPTVLADTGGVATHVLLVDPATSVVSLHGITASRPVDAIAAPPWQSVDVVEHPVVTGTADPDVIAGALRAVRLALAARALGAARRSHELALEHARSRHQFGSPIGAFQAVQHRLVDAAIDLAACDALLREAARGAAGCDGPLAAELALSFVAPAARRIQRAAQHTLAAVGYFEEHEAPWLFRRVYADTVRLRSYPACGGDAGDRLAETAVSLARIDRGPDAEHLREEISHFLAQHPPPAFARTTEQDPDVVDALAAAGWITRGLPMPGVAAAPEEAAVLDEELSYHRVPAPFARAAAILFGPTIARFGTEEQQRRLLPLIAEGRLRFYLGYSEPDVGSDLGSLTTRAVRDGDEWVVHGTKMWGTGADTADYVWLAARTDPDANPPHAGITVFLCPTRLPGWSARPHRALSGEISCTTFFDGVRIPDSVRIGEVNGGWKVITSALAAERVVMAGHVAALHRQLDDLLAHLRDNRPDVLGTRGSSARARVGALAARLQATRLLVARSVRATSTGAGRFIEAPMAKVLAGDVAEAFAEAALDLLGPPAALGAEEPSAPAGGAFEYGLRLAPMYVIGGGTADIQRNLIARGIGLPA